MPWPAIAHEDPTSVTIQLGSVVLCPHRPRMYANASPSLANTKRPMRNTTPSIRSGPLTTAMLLRIVSHRAQHQALCLYCPLDTMTHVCLRSGSN